MANSDKNRKTFSVSDIERYYSGKMPPTEMHELEKAALEDPFMADALEGYAHTQSASKDIADLKARFNKRTQQRKPNVLFLRAAAMVMILAGAGWLLYEVTFKDQDDRITYRNQVEMSNSQPVKDSFEKESALPREEAVVQESIASQESQRSKPAKDKEPQTLATGDRSLLKMDDLQSTDVIADSMDAAEERADIVSVAPAASQFKLMRTKRNESVDSNEAEQSIVVQNKTAPKDKIQISNNGNQVIINIQESEDGIHEMVLSRQKKDSLVKRSPSIIVEEAEPEESWNEFGAYLSDNMRSLEELQPEPLSGTIKLSFDVNTSGEPVNIQVENTLCKKCDAEALRLLKEGPKWKKKAKRGKVIINY